MNAPNHVKRLALLSGCILAGLVVAIIGSTLSGSTVWYAAVPAAIASGWIFVANPAQCEARTPERAERGPGWHNPSPHTTRERHDRIQAKPPP